MHGTVVESAKLEQPRRIKSIVAGAVSQLTKHHAETKQLKLKLAGLLRAEGLDQQKIAMLVDEGEKLSTNAYRNVTG